MKDKLLLSTVEHEMLVGNKVGAYIVGKFYPCAKFGKYDGRKHFLFYSTFGLSIFCKINCLMQAYIHFLFFVLGKHVAKATW